MPSGEAQSDADRDSAAEAAGVADTSAAGAGAARVISEEEVSALLEKSDEGSIKPYDFAAARISRTRLPMLEVIAKSFAERLGACWSALLARDAAVQFVSLDAAKAGDLQAALPVPATLATLRVKPLPGTAFVSLEPSLLLAMLDGYYGGTGRAVTDTSAAISAAAQRLQASLLRCAAADWAAAWMPIAPVELELVRQESNPRLMSLGSPQEAFLVLRFIVEFGAHKGSIDWLVPEGLIEPLREALEANGPQAPAAKQAAWGPALSNALQGAEVETRAVLAQTKISLRDLVRLAPGDVIPIEPPQHVVLLAGDVTLHRGRFGVSQGRNALKITSGESA